jgi:hypothetical protein
MVEQQPSKLNKRVRFPSPAPNFASKTQSVNTLKKVASWGIIAPLKTSGSGHRDTPVWRDRLRRKVCDMMLAICGGRDDPLDKLPAAQSDDPGRCRD